MNPGLFSRLIEELAKRSSADHLGRLRILRQIERTIEAEINQEIRYARDTRKTGQRKPSWSQIAEALGLKTPQAAQRRYLGAQGAWIADTVGRQARGRLLSGEHVQRAKPRTMAELDKRRNELSYRSSRSKSDTREAERPNV